MPMSTRAITYQRNFLQGVSLDLGLLVSICCSVILALSTYYIYSVWLLTFLPALFFSQKTRVKAFSVILSFYMVLNEEEFTDILHFFNKGIVISADVWIAHAVLLSIVWMLAYKVNSSPKSCFWRSVIFSIVLLFPPLGVFVWIQPIIASGALYPGLGWFGVLATITLMGLLTVFVKVGALRCHLTKTSNKYILIGIAALIAISLGANLIYIPAKLPSGVVAINTDHGKISASMFALVSEQQKLAALVLKKLQAGAKVIVLPENVSYWLPGSQELWAPVLRQAKANHALIFLGRVKALPHRKFDSGFEVVGATKPTFLPERMPMLLGEWNPLPGKHNQFNMHLPLPGIFNFKGETFAYLICYEQMIPYPLLRSLLQEKTTVIVSGANQWFASKASYMKQSISMFALARLFRIPVVVATNW